MITFLNVKPPVIAHRGASAYAPENTMSAFVKAVQLGVHWVEFDVMQAACGEVIVFHDERLDRTTNGTGLVNQFPYRYLQTLDAGSWFHPQFAGERIPTLQQVLEFLNRVNVSANIEIKPTPGNEELLIKHVTEIVAPFLSSQRMNILFSSFSIEALQSLRKYVPESAIGLLLHEWEPDWQDAAQALGCTSIHVNQEIMTPEAADNIKHMDKTLLCYTVNQSKRAHELFEYGVDAVFSDTPDLILAA